MSTERTEGQPDLMAALKASLARAKEAREGTTDDEKAAFTGALRRTWSLPPEPGPEVTAVRCDCHGVWVSEMDHGWWQLAQPVQPSMGPYRLHWPDLYRGCAPLSDATPQTKGAGE